MLKVLIVDDEPSNVYGLVRYIEWESLGYEQPMTCESGEEALELLKETAFDVLISDVSMPEMSGIELVAHAKWMYPQLQVLMISGYNEFEFVRDAIDVGAQAYVLKPLKLEEVASRLTSLRVTLEKMNAIKDQTRELEQKVSESIRVAKERFVSDLIAGIAQTEEMLSSWERLLELPQMEQGLRVIVFGLDHFLTSGQEARERVVLGGLFRKTIDIGLSDLGSLLFQGQTAPDEIVVLELNASPEERARMEKQFSFIQEMVLEQYGSTVTVGCSREGSGWGEAQLLYKEVRFMMAQSRLIADGQIARFEQLDSAGFKDYRLREELMPKMVKLMEEGDAPGVSGHMQSIFDLVLGQEPISFSHVQAFGMSFLSELIRALKWHSKTEGEINILMWRRLLDCSSTLQIVEVLTEVVDRYMTEDQHDQLNQQRSLIRRIAVFIEEKVKENWTVKQLAEQFNLNASYLSVLFKKEMGITISDYVQETRIKLARELLQDPSVKVYEVAEQVGIQTSAYFTYLFKKIVGCTPQEYRNYHSKEEGRDKR
ncbi:response regulator [Paenibacillus sp. NPDC058177]|uniref:response regulator n=1 Tax=Paenibacillus sp. NPDC058177 TaxID=3346369 RepID=UPI0036DA0B46